MPIREAAILAFAIGTCQRELEGALAKVSAQRE
jgi:hypothetical protein